MVGANALDGERGAPSVVPEVPHPQTGPVGVIGMAGVQLDADEVVALGERVDLDLDGLADDPGNGKPAPVDSGGEGLQDDSLTGDLIVGRRG